MDKNYYFLVLRIVEEGVNSACNFVSRVQSVDSSNDSEVAQDIFDNRAELKDNKLEVKFVSKNLLIPRK